MRTTSKISKRILVSVYREANGDDPKGYVRPANGPLSGMAFLEEVKKMFR